MQDVGSELALGAQLCQLADSLQELVEELRIGAGFGTTLTRRQVTAFTRGIESDDFIWTAVGITQTPKRVLGANPRRLSFEVILAPNILYRFAPSSFTPSLVATVDGTTIGAFGLTGHVGELWVTADTDVVASIAEQFAQPLEA